MPCAVIAFCPRGEKREKLAGEWAGPFWSREAASRGSLCWGSGEGSGCPDATSCRLPVCRARGTEPGRRKAQEEGCDFRCSGASAGAGVGSHSFLERAVPRPVGAVRCTVGERAAQLSAGACRRQEMTLRCQYPSLQASLRDWDTPSLPPTSSRGSRWCQRPP